MAFLSPFQMEKLEYYFKFFDANNNGYLEMADLDGFMKKVLDYTGLKEDSIDAKECREVHECFFETLIEKADKNQNEKIGISQWFSMWEHMLPGCTSMGHFPTWLRLLPNFLFRIIDRDQDGEIKEVELWDFYVNFVGLDKNRGTQLVKNAMEQMTDFGEYPLDLDSYNQIFANFLLGKTPYGPGRFIFGCFKHAVGTGHYHLIKGPPTTKKGKSPPKSKRHTSSKGQKSGIPLIKVSFWPDHIYTIL